ncbi:MAG: histidine triad nucleotide-binding protein [Firmicutes bacterium]|jgi:histidine triad (HIT) family protein|nr:histidine triad nucleotide-binding protein [Bacillota bacterium]
MAGDCVFCKIVSQEIPTEFLLETEHVVAFQDINPEAPTHLLVIPKKHITSISALEDDDQGIVGEIMLAIRDLAEKEQLDQGYRVVVNTGSQAGQTVKHLHFHLLGGRSLKWPPG